MKELPSLLRRRRKARSKERKHKNLLRRADKIIARQERARLRRVINANRPREKRPPLRPVDNPEFNSPA